MSLKRPRKIEVNIIDHLRIGPAELKTLLPDKASLERTGRIDDSRSNSSPGTFTVQYQTVSTLSFTLSLYFEDCNRICTTNSNRWNFHLTRSLSE